MKGRRKTIFRKVETTKRIQTTTIGLNVGDSVEGFAFRGKEKLTFLDSDDNKAIVKVEQEKLENVKHNFGIFKVVRTVDGLEVYESYDAVELIDYSYSHYFKIERAQ